MYQVIFSESWSFIKGPFTKRTVEDPYGHFLWEAGDDPNILPSGKLT